MKNSDGKSAEIHRLRPGQLGTKVARAPSHLGKEAQKWWRLIVSEFDLSDQGGLLLLQTAMEAFDRMRGAQRRIKKDGQTQRDRFGQLKAHPLFSVERDARSAMLAALRALNLDIEPLRDSPGRPTGY